jgi:tetratricopeptide (TPR) repeat protein
MLAILLGDLSLLQNLLAQPAFWAGSAFQLWMLVHALLQREWLWAAFILLVPGFGAFWYFWQIYWNAPSATRGFELPGAYDRRRIKELQAQIHHLDKAHHCSQLGDIYFHQGKLDQAESCYRAALERDPQDLDTRAHLGQCLLRKNQSAEALPLLQAVCAEQPKHDYGYSLMGLAEALAGVGQIDAAMETWQQVTANHSYARARVQLAELYLAKNQPDLARTELADVLSDAPHVPAFQRKRERVWLRKARKLLRKSS